MIRVLVQAPVMSEWAESCHIFRRCPLQCHRVLLLLQAKGKERQWLRNKTQGDLDDSKLIEGLTGEKAIYKHRGEQEPEVMITLRLWT